MLKPRGIIVSHTVERKDEKFSIDGGIDPIILKKYLLYWDSISYPMVNGFGPNLDVLPEMKYLESQGFLRLDEVFVNPIGIIPGLTNENPNLPIPYRLDLLAHGQLQLATDYLNKDEIWGIAQVGETLSFSSRDETSKSIVELSLFEGLPVPGVLTTFDDIINFRISHTKELNSLRVVLEKLRSSIIYSPEPDRALVLAREELSEYI